ncbi:MAG: hypothetical protein JRF63_05045 [Deltaproteobacteria bacterium]|nr:hypothetical protein [Deltaproteobacteria bacterium]
MRAAILLTLVCAVLTAAPAAADDLSHVSDDELSEELTARSGDIARTAERIHVLDTEELEIAVSLDEARTQIRQIEQRLAQRIELLYRLSRHGAALRYLMSAGSATELLKRLRTLRHLVIDGLEDRRRAGLRVAQLEERSRAVSDEQRQAAEMFLHLESAREDLLAEQSRRAGRRPFDRAR